MASIKLFEVNNIGFIEDKINEFIEQYQSIKGQIVSEIQICDKYILLILSK